MCGATQAPQVTPHRSPCSGMFWRTVRPSRHMIRQCMNWSDSYLSVNVPAGHSVVRTDDPPKHAVPRIIYLFDNLVSKLGFQMHMMLMMMVIMNKSWPGPSTSHSKRGRKPLFSWIFDEIPWPGMARHHRPHFPGGQHPLGQPQPYKPRPTAKIRSKILIRFIKSQRSISRSTARSTNDPISHTCRGYFSRGIHLFCIQFNSMCSLYSKEF